MAARRYEISLRVLTNISRVSAAFRFLVFRFLLTFFKKRQKEKRKFDFRFSF